MELSIAMAICRAYPSASSISSSLNLFFSVLPRLSVPRGIPFAIIGTMRRLFISLPLNSSSPGSRSSLLSSGQYLGIREEIIVLSIVAVKGMVSVCSIKRLRNEPTSILNSSFSESSMAMDIYSVLINDCRFFMQSLSISFLFMVESISLSVLCNILVISSSLLSAFSAVFCAVISFI